MFSQDFAYFCTRNPPISPHLMSTPRHRALQIAQERPVVHVNVPKSAKDVFASNVFTMDVLRQYVSQEAYDALRNSDVSTHIDRKTADEIASAMKAWAQSKGATHYTHWFQPLTGLTAEKHDAFFTLSMGDGRAIERFSGGELSQQEPDASSFPSGGIRNTFEARGYTGWDISSPAFILGTTLCIPSIFISYTGEHLDYKGPLLKTIALIDRAATDVCQFFERGVTKVNVTLGPEQEYFLVDRAFADIRPDLVLGGRTVFGAPPARGQQLEDHYFGSIPLRVQAFMEELEVEALALGIPLKTRHNEVAPGQFECAPFFEEMNVAVDHNQLLMDLMERLSRKHSLKVLLHEKPFAGVNGSGKHNNWSLSTNLGRNLFSPGKTPKDNLQFLTFLLCTLKAIHRHADLLRATIASAGNDHRLGANEAPPAIISAFLGQDLNAVLDELEQAETSARVSPKAPYKLGISRIPQLLMDTTDRNRTSPFAFTGNKFEFRAVGSSQNIAGPMIVLNLIVADQLTLFKQEVDQRLEKGEAKEIVIMDILRRYTRESKAIRFEGNGYSEAWKQEAAKRGLSNRTSTPEALDAYSEKSTVELFSKHGILSEREVHARHEILLETYCKKVAIEAQLMAEMALSQVIPAVMSYQREVLETIEGLQDLELPEASYRMHKDLATKISEHLNAVYTHVQGLHHELEAAEALEDVRDRAVAFQQQVIGHFGPLRQHVDALELLVDDAKWPLPKYREMLFVK